MLFGGDEAQLDEHWVQHAAEVGLIPWCSKDFSPGVNFQCRLSYRCLYKPHVQSYALVSVHICEKSQALAAICPSYNLCEGGG